MKKKSKLKEKSSPENLWKQYHHGKQQGSGT
jgi:hypothetical protein